MLMCCIHTINLVKTVSYMLLFVIYLLFFSIMLLIESIKIYFVSFIVISDDV